MRYRPAEGLFRSAVAFSFLLCLAGAVLVAESRPASALSEIKREEVPPSTSGRSGETAPPNVTAPVPLPDPIVSPRNPEGQPQGGDDEEDFQLDDSDSAEEKNAPTPEVSHDFNALPEPVRRMRELIMEAAASGDIERLRPLVGSGETMTQLSLGGITGDPIQFMKELSGDSEGQEILAILYEVLDTGYVHLEPGTDDDMYVWPYFFAVPLDELDERQRFELFKIVTAGDYEDMKNYGSYIFYRVGISPEGKWLFFVAGD
ncbi:hypothetical protein [Aquamicrobium sp. LC103]|uniref:hypothetical protein n=1 Tax=Aquamicrobium sp. LC103 TaxID=1120658 RepID=UPI00063EC796|nr:hypothetical protein [Aquamicrobium sp. LC103]